MLIPETLRHATRIRPSHPALVDGERRLSYTQLSERTHRAANLLREGLGLDEGDRFLLLSTNRLEFADLYLGAAEAGVVCAPVNPRLAGPELAEIAEDAGARVVIAERGLQDRVETMRERGMDQPVVWLGDRSGERCEYSDLLGQASAQQRAGRRADEEVVLQVYTSGTTGTPKAVMLSHRSLTANSWHMIVEGAVHPQDRQLSSAPLAHLGAGVRIFLQVHAAATHVIHQRFDPERVIDSMIDGEVNAALIVPAMVPQLLEVAATREGSLKGKVRQLIYATAPMPYELLEETIGRLDCDLMQTYGQTEAGTNLTVLPPADHRRGADGKYLERLKSAGRETTGVHVRVVDDNDQDVPIGEVGEIIARGDNIMEGYWEKPEETAATLRNGWLHTGDLGTVDGDGYVYVVGRKKDMLISGGFNVYPGEIERQLEVHPAVREVAVVGVPDERWGEVPVAFVVASEQISDEKLIAELRQRCDLELARFKAPKHYRLIDTLPRNGVDKVDKNRLRALLESTG